MRGNCDSVSQCLVGNPTKGQMEEAVEKLGKSLALIETEQEDLVIQQGDWAGTIEHGGYLLVGRILASKAYRVEVIRSTLTAVMNPKRGMDIREIEDNLLLFRFNHPLNRARVLEGRPWTFERNLIVLGMVGADDNPMMGNLDWCPFHVHIHGLPLRQMTMAIARHIGNQLGNFIDRDQGTTRSWGSTMRIRAELDVCRALVRCLKICSPTGSLTELRSPTSDSSYSVMCVESWVISRNNVIDRRAAFCRYNGGDSHSVRGRTGFMEETQNVQELGERRGVQIFEPIGKTRYPTNTHYLESQKRIGHARQSVDETGVRGELENQLDVGSSHTKGKPHLDWVNYTTPHFHVEVQPTNTLNHQAHYPMLSNQYIQPQHPTQSIHITNPSHHISLSPPNHISFSPATDNPAQPDTSATLTHTGTLPNPNSSNSPSVTKPRQTHFIPSSSASLEFLDIPNLQNDMEKIQIPLISTHTHDPFVPPSPTITGNTTKCNKKMFQHIRGKFDMFGIEVAPRGRSGGLMLRWDKAQVVHIRSYSSEFIDADVYEAGEVGKWRFTGFYGNPDATKRKKSWERLVQLSRGADMPWVCLGDFNELLVQHQKTGVTRPGWQIRNFWDALQKSGLTDMGFEGPKFTWWNQQEHLHTVRARLDGACGNYKWFTKFPNARVSHLPLLHSDHRPLLLENSANYASQI
ncbi:UNVERIFIED_CONTAM: hypothetical protein Slati_1170400 [Sesamum latifolium]|uniref:DUF4283 domain-containing protein n=1 Tax=Sesamum latifolium TaxID=2727402 RepID=A0AAW2XE02_9LAMI